MRATELNQPPSSCYQCGAEGADLWKAYVGDIAQEYRGEFFQIPGTSYHCTHCGYQYVPKEQVLLLVRQTVAQYREKYGLLSSEAIMDYRHQLGMNQSQFAEHIGVGVASIKRWEKGYVQDRSNDRLIRQKMRADAFDASKGRVPSQQACIFAVPFNSVPAYVVTYSAPAPLPKSSLKAWVCSFKSVGKSLLQDTEIDAIPLSA